MKLVGRQHSYVATISLNSIAYKAKHRQMNRMTTLWFPIYEQMHKSGKEQDL